MIKLWLKENDIPELTSFAGNIDADKLKPFIFIAQSTDLKPILGSELYEKINNDYTAGTLADEYLTMYSDYIVYMLVYFACSHYVAFAHTDVNNNGITKPEQSAPTKEVNSLSARYRALANNVLVTFTDWIGKNPVPEYRNACTIKRKTNIIPWH